jgi:catecholate siderophore receptor
VHDRYRATLDYSQPLADTAAVRVNAMFTDFGSFRDPARSERWGIAPTMGIRPSASRRAGRSRISAWTRTTCPTTASPTTRACPIDVPVERYYGLAEADFEDTRTDIGTAVLEHRFTPGLTFRDTLRYARYERSLWPSAPQPQRREHRWRAHRTRPKCAGTVPGVPASTTSGTTSPT